MRKKIVLKMQLLFVMLLLSVVSANGISVCAEEEIQPIEEEYQLQYDDAIKLAELLRTSPYLVHNKLYTKEQETDLQVLVDSVCEGKQNDREKAEALLSYIGANMEPGECYELNGWDTLCDGETEMSVTVNGEEMSVPKREAEEQTYCFTFYDICRLANIPCFILEDCAGEYEIDNKYICMVYVENESGTEKLWHFVDVRAENGQLITREDVYGVMGQKVFPMNILLDYDKMMNVMNVIYLNKETMLSYSAKRKITPHLVYDREINKVKTYFRDGTLANGEQYCRSETSVSEEGEAPCGWIETRTYSGGTVTKYWQYSLYGVFLRGRIEKDDTEYTLAGDFNDSIPYKVYVGVESESEEHKAYVSAYKQKLQNLAIQVASALLEDENYLWDDMNFTEEEETLLREAVETALDWDYITGDEESVLSFENAGISLENEDPEALSDKAKAQAILMYIKRNVESSISAPTNVSSPMVLTGGEGTCDGITLLYRDMCVLAGLPCFRLACAMDMSIGDSFFVDHGNNLVKVGDEWLFVEPTNSSVVGMGTGYLAAFLEGYTTASKSPVYLDCEMMRKDNYYKWNGGNNVLNYYDFDDEGNLGIYRRNRFEEPVPIASGKYQTDENGRYVLENGLHTVDLTETSEDGTAQVVMRYAYYYQNTRLLEGDKIIDGEEYHFTMEDINHYSYHKVGEQSRRYYIAKLEFKEIEDQPYNKNGVSPIPEIYHGEKKLELGKDFRIVEYMHNKELTTYVDASYKVEGIGDYVDTATRYFKIVQADISNLEVTLSQTSYEWTPGTYCYRPEVEVELSEQDYYIEYFNFDDIGKASVVLTGKGNYKGSITKHYDIKKRELTEEDFKILDRYNNPLQSQEFMYRFYPIKTEATLYWYDENGSACGLIKGEDYDLSYTAYDKPGVVTVTATAKGMYQGSVSCTYTIKEYDIIDNSAISYFMDYEEKDLKVSYTGSPVQPQIPKIEDLEEGVHYTMTVTNNVNVGTAKITFRGIGVCIGTYEKEFEITPGILRESEMNVEYTYTTYNGTVQKPSVTINSKFVEGKDYFISYTKKVGDEYQETEPKEVGEYWIVIRASENVLIRQAGADDTDVYYFSYNINGDGTGNSGTGNTGTGNSGTGNTGAGNTGTENSGSETGTGNTDTGNTGSENSGSDSDAGTINTGSSASESEEKDDTKGVSSGSQENTNTSNTTYKIKKLSLISMKKSIKLKWSKVKNAKGYQIQISVYKNFKKAKKITVKKSKKSCTLKKLQSKKKYYIRIRAYGKNGKKTIYGKWKKSSKKTK